MDKGELLKRQGRFEQAAILYDAASQLYRSIQSFRKADRAALRAADCRRGSPARTERP